MTGADLDERVVDRTIVGDGTTEAEWFAGRALVGAPTCDVAAMAACHPTIHIVSPHPDDEILAVGGLMAQLWKRGAHLSIVAVTNGGASHPGSSRWTAERLEQVRPVEAHLALSRLGIGAPVRRLNVPDGAVATHEAIVADHLASRFAEGDLVIAPWRFDGHPDHEACGRAAEVASRAARARFIEYPVWAWHWAHPESLPWARTRRVILDEETANRKRSAIREFTSQLEPDGPRAPVLPARVLERFTRPFEILFVQ